MDIHDRNGTIVRDFLLSCCCANVVVVDGAAVAALALALLIIEGIRMRHNFDDARRKKVTDSFVHRLLAEVKYLWWKA